MSIEWEGVTLDNVADGLLEQLFQDQIPNIIEAFADPAQFECVKKQINYTLKMALRFTMSTESGTLTVAAQLVPVPPKPRAYERGAKIRSGGIVVEKAVQQDLDLTDYRSEGDRQGPLADPDLRDNEGS